MNTFYMILSFITGVLLLCYAAYNIGYMLAQSKIKTDVAHHNILDIF